jgi:acetylornithine deacetylase/succinyl-diaminopimelate desuccinylase-like protein
MERLFFGRSIRPPFQATFSGQLHFRRACKPLHPGFQRLERVHAGTASLVTSCATAPVPEAAPPAAAGAPAPAEARARNPGAPVTTNVISGFTDCNAFRAHGKTCYGFLPMHITLDDIERIHGKDERINLEALSQSVIDLHALVQNLQSPPG